jgi:hypothetical protein
MQEIFNQQTVTAATINDLDNISNLLNDLPAPSTGTPPKITLTPDQYNQIVQAYNTAISDLSSTNGSASQMLTQGETTPLGKELLADLQAFASEPDCTKDSGNFEIYASTITNNTTNLKTYTSSLNSDGETQMINLQSLMSSRQTAVELATNMLETLSSTDLSIAANLKSS